MGERYDYLVVGGGSAGLTGAIMSGRLGAKTLLVDKEQLGGDCLHTGCVPSKSLIASARIAASARSALSFGVRLGEVEVDFASVMERVRDVQRTIGASELEAVSEHGVELAFGGCQLLGRGRALVGLSREVEFKFALLATGSQPWLPEIRLLSSADPLTTDTLWELESLPPCLAILGGGPIAVELGQALQRLGSQITIFERESRLIPRADRDASLAVQRALEDDGVDVRTGADVSFVHRMNDKTMVTVGDASIESFDQLLVATGRSPRTDGLGLEATRIKVTRRGIKTDDTLLTSEPGVYAAGDVTGGAQFTHWAEHQARVATRNALFAGSERVSALRLPQVTFTDPEVASVGITLEQALERKLSAEELRVSMTHVDRAVCDGQTQGVAKVVIDDKQRILGAHLVGAHAGEAIGEWVLAMEEGLTLGDVGKAIHAYPTMSRMNRRLDDERFYAHGVANWKTKLFGRF